jgi:alanine racemase
LPPFTLQALRSNLAPKSTGRPRCPGMGSVKANAYGHGIERVFEGLRGADGFALLDLEEAQRVRDLGWRGPVLLLEGAFEVA